ncbi:T-cell surface glycoprotein CD3 epsilon chain [Sphaerodactylus townsendi]|uniref:Uncharacterized protein n=1 Tax=Sphaerodactylus townsendi TaxID=933632 RepID=A0ACB8EYD1_9SAUR|nr:T-cell surface glycoprotein CD3 epsilon chain [Sphaerodactylus townsendi]
MLGGGALNQHQEATVNVMVFFGVTTSSLALWLCLPSLVRGQESNKIKVSISGNGVTLTCPIKDAKWWRKEKNGSQTPTWTIENYQGMQHNDLYSCGTKEPSCSIYLHIKECPGCVEMDLWLATGIIVADLLFTVGILILTYYCSRKRAARFGGVSAAAGPRAQPQGQREDRPPPVPNPDYEPIRKGQREVYAGLEPRAF